MKKITLSLTVLVVAVMATAQIMKTQLTIIVMNDLGNIEEGVEVVLYKSEEDYNNNKPCTEMKKTDAKGKVKFKNLEPVSYFIEAKKGSKSNMFGGEKTEPLVKNRPNKVNVIISG